MPITHTFQTAKSDGSDATLVQGTYWNTVHTITNVDAVVSGTPIAVSDTVFNGTNSVNSWTQIHVANKSTGTAASSDVVCTRNNGSDTTGFINMGINGSGYSTATWTINTANDGYLYTQDGNLAIGIATTAKNLILFTGGTLSTAARVTVTDTSVTFAPPIILTTTAASTTEGAVWHDTTQNVMTRYNSNTQYTTPGVLWTKTAATTLATYTTATAAIGTAGTGVGTLTIGTGALALGKSILVKMAGVMGSSAVSTGHTLALTIGGTSVCTTGASTIPASLTNRGWWAEFVLTCRATGASGFVFGSGFIQVHTAAAGTAHIMFSTNTTTTAAANTSTALALGVTSAWASAHASNTFTCHNCVIYILN